MTLDPDDLGRSKAELADLLRRLRLDAGLTGERLAARCSMSQSKVSKIETGKLTPSVVDVELVLRALNISPDVAREVLALSRLANTEWQEVRALWRRGAEKRQAELAALEENATTLRYFLPAMITGLLATPDYVRASLKYAPGDVSRTVARKLERQSVLLDPAKSFTFVLTEQAMRWAVVEPQAMALQVDRLISLSKVPSVHIGVVPFGVHQPRGPMNTFTIYDDRLVTVETFTGRLVLHDSRDVAEHLELFEDFRQFAVFGDGARRLLADCATSFRSQSMRARE